MHVRELPLPSFTSELNALARRLTDARLPPAGEWMGWDYGLDPVVFGELIAYWRDEFDARTQLARLGKVENLEFVEDDQVLHFVRVRDGGDDPIPMVLVHGWPSSVFELLPVAQRLAAALGTSADHPRGVDVIVPSLPGFGLSSAPDGPGLNSSHAAHRIRALMCDGLGYERFYAHGGDFGANVCNRLALFYPNELIGIHVMAALYPGQVTIDTPLTEAEEAFVAYSDEWYQTHGAYLHLQQRQPQTVAYALSDSPIGLAAWLFEKFWSWCDFDNDIREVVSFDELLTNITWYWVTNSIGSANRYYADYRRDELPERPRIDVPTRLFLTLEKVDRCPREWAERIYSDLDYELSDTGGHFLAVEQPDLLAANLADFLTRPR